MRMADVEPASSPRFDDISIQSEVHNLRFGDVNTQRRDIASLNVAQPNAHESLWILPLHR